MINTIKHFASLALRHLRQQKLQRQAEFAAQDIKRLEEEAHRHCLTYVEIRDQLLPQSRAALINLQQALQEAQHPLPGNKRPSMLHSTTF